MNNVDFLIVSSSIDYSTDLICIEFETRNLKYLRINRDYFDKYKILYLPNEDKIIVNIEQTNYEINSVNLKAVYFRAPVFVRNTGKTLSLEKQLYTSQWNSFIRNLIILDNAFWLNHPVNIYRAENKLYQLKIASKNGLTVPKTFVGNTLPDAISAKETYIVKSLDTALFYDNGYELFTYSTMVRGDELTEAEISCAPIIIQECLHQKIDLRITVVGRKIFAVKITLPNQEIEGDWRKIDKANLKYIPLELPLKLKESIHATMSDLRLSFGGMDMALVGGKYYFIEVNPTGEWGWLTSSAKLPIDKAIVDCLVAGGVF